jgi:hypothetical protein
MYVVAGAIGAAGAFLGYSKPVSMFAAVVVALAIEGVNYVVHRSKAGTDS